MMPLRVRYLNKFQILARKLNPTLLSPYMYPKAQKINLKKSQAPTRSSNSHHKTPVTPNKAVVVVTPNRVVLRIRLKQKAPIRLLSPSMLKIRLRCRCI